MGWASSVTAKCIFYIFCTTWALIPSYAFSQETSEPTIRETYTPEDFRRFAPRSALDMVEQIPGFVIREGGSDRGFGQADTNVLINGRRISGKSNGPLEALGRITASDVVRLEIVDGASLDIGGLSGQVLNVVTSGDGISGQWRYSPAIRTDQVPIRLGNAEISLSGGGAKTQWTVRLGNFQNRTGDRGPEIVRDAAGMIIDTRFESRIETVNQPGLAASLARTATNGNVLNLTGEVNGFFLDFDEISQRTNTTEADRVRTFSQTEDEFNFELGGDYEFAFGPGRLKLIGLHRFENSPFVDSVLLEFADDQLASGTNFTQTADEAETIARLEYTQKAFDGDWQWSLEGVRNFVETRARLETQVGDQLIPEELPGASSRVEEDRAETTLSYGRALTPQLQLQTSLGVEYSQITQTGAAGLVRDFIRPNGFISLNWKPSDDLAVSARLERVVGQLNFFDFIASVNVNQDRVNVTNANLVPPQSWLAELEMQKQLGAYGSITLRAFGEEITDIVDRIPIEGGGQAPGNIDSARRYGGNLDLTLISDPTGWRGLRYDLSVLFVESAVADPLTGITRRISNEDIIEVETTLRQDFLSTDWAVGLIANYEEDARLTRIDEISVMRQRPPFAQVFIENKDVFGATVRLRVGNIFDSENSFRRTIFTDRAAGLVDFTEDRRRQFGTIFRLDIEGSF